MSVVVKEDLQEKLSELVKDLSIETILEVMLDKAILPRTKVVFDMEWEAQVPLQVRRSGRDNPDTKVRYTMTQWYPKMVEYDKDGWHPTPYIAREFYGVWGDYDVTINIDKKLQINLKSATAFLPAGVTAKVYAIYQPNKKSKGFNSTHSFDSSKEERIQEVLKK